MPIYTMSDTLYVPGASTVYIEGRVSNIDRSVGWLNIANQSFDYTGLLWQGQITSAGSGATIALFGTQALRNGVVTVNKLLSIDGSSTSGIDGSSVSGIDGSSVAGIDGSSVLAMDHKSLLSIDGSSAQSIDGSSSQGIDGSSWQ